MNKTENGEDDGDTTESQHKVQWATKPLSVFWGRGRIGPKSTEYREKIKGILGITGTYI